MIWRCGSGLDIVEAVFLINVLIWVIILSVELEYFGFDLNLDYDFSYFLCVFITIVKYDGNWN